MDLDAAFGEGTHVFNLVAAAGQERFSPARIGELFHVDLVELVIEFTSPGVQHQLGDRAASAIECDAVEV